MYFVRYFISSFKIKSMLFLTLPSLVESLNLRVKKLTWSLFSLSTTLAVKAEARYLFTLSCGCGLFACLKNKCGSELRVWSVLFIFKQVTGLKSRNKLCLVTRNVTCCNRWSNMVILNVKKGCRSQTVKYNTRWLTSYLRPFYSTFGLYLQTKWLLSLRHLKRMKK